MFKATLINLGLRMLDKYLVSKIQLEELKLYVKGLFDDLKKLVDLLTDKNPNNLDQLRAFWAENKKILVKDTIPTAKAIIVKEIKDVNTRDLILELIAAYEEEQGLANGKVIA